MTKPVYAGIDIGATNIKFGLIDDGGNVKYRNFVSTPKEDSAEAIFETVCKCGETLLIEADEIGGQVDFVGVGSPGSVNVEAGIIQGSCPNLPEWVGFELRARLAERLNLPVRIDNDANCAALAEFRFGAGKGYRNLICLTIGTGIGGGLIIDRRLYHGSDYSAGEVGHMVWPISKDDGDRPCYLEKIVSAPAILAAIREELEKNMTPAFHSLIGRDWNKLTMRRVFAAIKRGDRLAPKIIMQKARNLGTALAGLVNVINPELIILGGGVAEGGSLFIDGVKEELFSSALPVASESLSIVPARLGNRAGFIGAAFLDA